MIKQQEKFSIENFTKYEIARIIGARALQVSMNAPLILKISKEELENINYNPIEIAKKEFYSGVLPISVIRPLPGQEKVGFKKEIEVKKEEKIEEVEEEIKEIEKEEEAEKPEEEKKGEKKEKEEEIDVGIETEEDISSDFEED